MPYLPKHYIKTGLFANPGSFLDRETGQGYAGPYYAIATGQYFTGDTPQDPQTREIIPAGTVEQAPGVEFQEVGVAFNLDILTLKPGESSNNIQNRENFQIYQPDLVSNYLAVKKYPESYYNSKRLPFGVTPVPDENDYSLGEYTRYFCKKVNELTYKELDNTQYVAITQEDPTYLWDQYLAFSLPWLLTGTRQEVGITNRKTVLSRMTTYNLLQFDRFLNQDYLRFYKGS